MLGTTHIISVRAKLFAVFLREGLSLKRFFLVSCKRVPLVSVR